MSKENKIIELNKKYQISSSVAGWIYQEIMDMAHNEKRSDSQMAAILLENAVKERRRQRRKNGKEDQA